MKIALAQINTIVGDLQGNYEKITQYIDKAKKAKCEIVVFPELAISGYPPEDLLLKQRFIMDQYNYVSKLFSEVKDIVVVLGYIQPRPNNKPYNACIVFKNGKQLARHYKNNLPNYSVFDEKRYFSSDNTIYNSSFVHEDKVIAINICEDIWVEDVCKDQKDTFHPDIIINISCSPYYTHKIKEREALLKKRAIQHNTNIIYCNLVGGQDELVFDGGSMVINRMGGIEERSPQFKEHLLIYNPEAMAREEIAKIYPNGKEIWEALKLGLRDYVRKNGFQKVVLGMSGGIDSALVAKLAVDTLGKENVVCVSMPSQYSSEGTQSDAESYSKELGVYFNTFPIKNLFDGYVNYLQPWFKDTKKDVTEENIQARIRGNIIMAFSNKFGYLPIVCSNKSETAVGYFTHFGDNSGGFAPIKDLYKTDVIKLAKFVSVPESIINRPPSAELSEGQKDEDSLPSYEILDKILKKFINNKQQPETELENKIYKLILRSEWKRRYSPTGIKIQKEGWGKDWRMPITNGYKPKYNHE